MNKCAFGAAAAGGCLKGQSINTDGLLSAVGFKGSLTVFRVHRPNHSAMYSHAT